MDRINGDKQASSEGVAPKMAAGQPVSDVEAGDLILYDDIDPALGAKMHLLNQAINEIGWTNYHLKLFFLNGFGYAVDSLLTFLIGVANPQAVLEFEPSYSGGAQIALYVGLLAGALFWGLSADVIGRRWAFNLSLLLSSIFTIIAGASPNYNGFATLVALAASGAGGNLVLDTTVFLEFLPSKYQFMIIIMALWWGIGQTVAALLGWAFMPNFSCATADVCTKSNNMGWRYVYYTGGALVLVLSMLRIFVLRFRETPKYLLCSGQDEEVISLLHDVAAKYNRPCSLTLEQLQQHGSVTTAHAKSVFSLKEIGVHYKGLFATKKLCISTTLLWLSWACIGLAYPLYYMFLPEYLASRGAVFGESSAYITWRNYTLTQFCAIFGPLLAGYITTLPKLGRKYTMVIGALMTMAFFYGYTAVKNADQNLAMNCLGSFSVNVYFSALYAYTPEVLPSSHRGTGNGTAVSCARVMGTVAVVIGSFSDKSSPQPIFVCASLFVVMAIIAAVAPYEPQMSQSV